MTYIAFNTYNSLTMFAVTIVRMFSINLMVDTITGGVTMFMGQGSLKHSFLTSYLYIVI